MRYYELVGTGGPKDLALKERDTPSPGIGQVLMRTTSVGVNRAELMATSGHYPMSVPGVPGMEGGGEIVAVGAAAGKWKAGDWVSPAHGAFLEKGRGSYADHVLIDEEDLVAAPKNLDPTLIGGLWLPYVTAYHGLVHVGGLKEKQIVVIPAATSSVGIAAIQVARDLGARPIPYTTRASKLAALSIAAEIDPATAICVENETLKAGLERVLGQERPSMFFDPIGGDFLEEELAALKPGGTIILYGGLGGRGNVLTGRVVMKKARILGHHLGTLRDDRSLMRATYRTLVEKIESGVYKPVAARLFPFEKAREALEFMAENSHVGKIYLTA